MARDSSSSLCENLLPFHSSSSGSGQGSVVTISEDGGRESSREKKNHLGTEEEYKSYRYRWVVLSLFSFLNASNALLWVTFAPISDLTMDYFSSVGGSGAGIVGTITAVNFLAVIFQILYGPGTLLGVYWMKNYGLRGTVIMGGMLSTVGSFFRLIGSLVTGSHNAGLVYGLFFIGQSLGALAQPFFLNLPTAISNAWFPVDERDTATTIGSLVSPLGNAIGQIFPVVLVAADGKGMDVLMGLELAINCVATALAYAYFREKPPTAPSHSTFLRNSMTSSTSSSSSSSKAGDMTPSTKAMEDVRAREESLQPQGFSTTTTATATSSSSSMSPLSYMTHVYNKYLLHEGSILMGDKDFVFLFLSFSVGVGIFNTVLTLINQLVEPQGYTNDDAGTFGSVLIVCGLVGAGIAGKIMQTTKAYRTVLKCGFVLCLCAMFFLICMLRPGNGDLLTFAFAVLGFTILPMLPVALENSAECTYPVSEDLTVGLLFLGGNTLGIAFTFIMQVLLELPPWGGANANASTTPSNAFILSLVLLACIFLVFYNGKYKRLECESSNLSAPLIRNDPAIDEEVAGRTGGGGMDMGGDSVSGSEDPDLARVCASSEESSLVSQSAWSISSMGRSANIAPVRGGHDNMNAASKRVSALAEAARAGPM